MIRRQTCSSGVLLGVERVEIEPGATVMTPVDFVSYPYSHSLLALSVWGALFGIVYVVVRHRRPAAGVTLALVVAWAYWVDGHRRASGRV
jgi:hypothetical protein